MIDDCELWTGGTHAAGYGQAKRPGGGYISAHVLAVLLDGREIPAGYHVHHRCGVKLCVNPAHLEVLSPGDHMRTHRPPSTACQNGHPRSRSVYKSDGRLAYCRDCANAKARARPKDDPSRIADRQRAARWYAEKKRQAA